MTYCYFLPLTISLLILRRSSACLRVTVSPTPFSLITSSARQPTLRESYCLTQYGARWAGDFQGRRPSHCFVRIGQGGPLPQGELYNS